MTSLHEKRRYPGHEDRPDGAPCWRCGDGPEAHIPGQGCQGYTAGDPAFGTAEDGAP